MPNYLLIDGNSLGHFAQNGAKLTLGTMEVQAIYNFLRNIRETIQSFQNYTPVVLWDGASWRHQIYAEYKADRERSETINEKRLKLMRDAYKQQRPKIMQALQFLGVAQVSALNMEADDLAAILADRYAQQGKVILFTGDQDWLQLVGPNVIWRDFIKKRTVAMNNFEEFTGVKTTAEYVEWKALVGGDDNISGVGGVGDKGAVEFIKTYGSFNNFLNQVTLEKTIDITKLPKKYRDLVQDEGKAITFERNIRLMDLRTPHRPPAINLKVDKGEPSAEKIKRFCEILLFNRITENFDSWVSAFPAFRKAALAA